MYMDEMGAKVLAVSDVSCTLYHEDGLDIKAVMEFAQKNKTKVITGFPGAQKELDRNAILTLDVEILMPCALENVFKSDNAADVKAKIVCEGANGPTTPEADKIMNEKGILVVPDILANAGGVTVSYFEWVQNLMRYNWTFEEVQEKQEKSMMKAFDDIWTLMEERDVNMRTAAYMMSIKRVADAMKLRGWY
jgi:glutamate dehydrogenase